MIGFRLSAYDTPFPPSPSRRTGRFNREGGPVANYWSLHPHGPWAEQLRWNRLLDEPDAAQLRGRVWAARLDLDPDRVVTVDFATAPRHGLTPEQLVADDHLACRDAADRWRADGVDAVIVPSAALPGTSNLVLFGQRLAVAWLGPVVDRDLDVPCAVVADRAGPPPGLALHVRHYGAPHPALDASRAGREFDYDQQVEVA